MLEHLVLNSLHAFVYKIHLFTHTMIRFRPGLSTQDVMLRPKQNMFDCLHTRAILGRDLAKTLYIANHETIKECLESLCVSSATLNNVRDI